MHARRARTSFSGSRRGYRLERLSDTASNSESRLAFEFLADIRHFLVDALLLQLAHPRAADVGNELRL